MPSLLIVDETPQVHYYIAQQELTNGESITGFLTTDYDTDMYSIEVQPGAYVLNVVLSGSSGDFDVYARYAVRPTTDEYDLRGYDSDSYEDESIEAPAHGTWYIMVRSYSGSGSYSLVVHVHYYSDATTYSPSTPVLPQIPLITENDLPNIAILSLSMLGLIAIIGSLKRS